MEDVHKLFEKFTKIKIGVIGDVMLDTYMWGDVERISPEAPVPIVALKKKDLPGGRGGQLSLKLQSLDANAYVISVTGNDEDAVKLNELFADQNINTQYCFKSEKRITTNKTRVISRNQHMMRLDAEITKDLDREDQQQIIECFKRFVSTENPQLVILQDYNKGVLTEEV